MSSNDNDSNSENIKVFVRVRPPNERELENGSVEQYVQADTVKNTVSIMNGSRLEMFTFDKVADKSTTQEEIFRTVGKTLTDNCLRGYNATIFAYGQTGAGKTFTMHGPSDQPDGLMSEQRGVIPRTFEYLFTMINREQKKNNDRVQYLCKCSYIEIYQENIYDLLQQVPSVCQIREDLKKGVYVDGATEESINSPEDAYKILQRGSENRHVAETAMNHESSRSHSVFMLFIHSKTKDGAQTIIKESRFNLVDLAGSERQKDTRTADVRLKEAGQINKSLHVLGGVINALVDLANGKQRHVHYRDSKLTFLLRDSLGGNSKTCIIANASPSSLCLPETLSTLRFARSAKMIKNTAVVNEDSIADIAPLKDEIRLLKLQLQQLMQQSGLPVTSSLSQDKENELIVDLLLRLQESEEKQKRLEDETKLLQKLAEQRLQQFQSQKMLIRMRESALAQLKQQLQQSDKDTFIQVEQSSQMDEIKELRRLIENHPDVTKFAHENIILRNQINELQRQLEECTKPVDLFAARERERRLELLVLSLTVQNRKLIEERDTNQTINLQHQIDELTASLNDYHERLTAETKKAAQANDTVQELQREVAKMREQKKGDDDEIDSLTKQSKDLETALDDLRLSKDLETKRLCSVIENLRDQHSQASTDVSAISAQLANAQAEGTRLRQKSEERDAENTKLKATIAKLEQKARRMSDFASESRLTTQESLRMMTERLSMLSAEKDLTDNHVTELLRKVDEKRREAEQLRLTVQSLEKEKMELEEENIRMDRDLRRQVDEIEKLNEQLQTLQSEMETLQDELSFHTQQTVRDDHDLRSLRSKSSELNAENQALKSKYEQVCSQVSLLMSQGDHKYNDAIQQANELREELAVSHEHREALENEAAQQQREIAIQAAKLSKAERDHAADQQALKDLLEKVQELREKLSSVEIERSELLQAVDVLQATKTSLFEREKQVGLLQQDLQSSKNDLEQLQRELSDTLAAHATSIQQAQQQLKQYENENNTLRTQIEGLNREKEEQGRLQQQASEQQNSLLSSLRKSTGNAPTGSASDVAALEQELEAQILKVATLEEQQALLRKEKDDEIKSYRSQLSLQKDLVHHIEILKSELLKAREQPLPDVDQLTAELSQSVSRAAVLETQLAVAIADKRRAETEMQQHLFHLRNAEEDISSLVEANKRASEMEEQEHRHAEELASQLRQLKERFAAMEDERNRAVIERDQVRLDNEQLVVHGNTKQKLQYHLKIKKENNDLREENQSLRQALVKFSHGDGHHSSSRRTLLTGSENRP